MSSLIELKKITKTYQMGENTQTVLHGIDVTINSGEMVAIMGPSGSGKSTIMNIIGLLDRPTSGSYTLNEKETDTMKDNELANLRNQQIGFVFQQFFLLAKLNARFNVGLPLSYRGVKPKEIDERVEAMLEKVGMSDRGHHKPSELSGGQQQRVAIARALVARPSLILADEPTGALDTHTGREVMDIFLKLHKEDKKTIIIVTHDPKIAAQCARVIRVEDGNILVE